MLKPNASGERGRHRAGKKYNDVWWEVAWEGSEDAGQWNWQGRTGLPGIHL